MDGDRALRTTTFEFRSLPGGTFDVTATLIGVSRKTLSLVRDEVNVISNGAGR